MLNLSQIKHANTILNLLINNDSYMTVDDLQNAALISRRSVFYTLKKINVELNANNLDSISSLKGIGYYLTDETKNSINLELTKTYNKIPKYDRQVLIIWDLINHGMISNRSCMTKFNISSHTAIEDITSVTKILKKRNLNVEQRRQGKILTGSSVSSRLWILEQLNTRLSPIHKLINIDADTNATIEESLHDLETKSGNYFTENAIEILTEFISWLLPFVKDTSNNLNDVPDSYASQSKKVVCWADTLLAQFDIVNKYESLFLSQIINTIQFSQINDSDELTQQVQQIAHQMIEKFNSISGSNIESNSLELSLTTHLLSTLYRTNLQINYAHPDINDFVSSHNELFIFTKYAVTPFEKFINKKLSDDEISLITIYFGGQLQDMNRSRNWDTDVLIVCSSGIGTSTLLKNQLTNRYPNVSFSEPLSGFQFDNCPLDDVKLIVSTISLEPTQPVPLIKVSPLLTQENLKKIDQELNSSFSNTDNYNIQVETIIDIISDYVRIEDSDGLSNALNNYFKAYSVNSSKNKPAFPIQKPDIIPLQNITKLSTSINWTDAIKDAFKPLRQNGSVTNNYIEKIIDLTNTKGPFMFLGNGVFLAHAAPNDGVKKMGISILSTDKNISLTVNGYQPKEIRLIIALAPIDKEQHLENLAIIFKKIQNPKWLDTLNKSHSKEEIFNLLK